MIFVVLADDALRSEVGSLLRDDGYVTRFFATSAEALPRAEQEAPDLIIVDESLAIADGHSILATYHERFPKRATRFLLLFDPTERKDSIEPSSPDGNRRLPKPLSPEEFRAAVGSMLGYSSQDAAGDDAAPPSDSQRGKLSGINVGGRTFHVQTEAQGRDAGQISTVVVVDGQVRLKKIVDTAPDSTAEDIVRQIEEQHEAVEEQIRSKISALQQSKRPAPASERRSAEEIPSKWDLLKQASAKVKARDFDGALAVLAEAQKHYPDDPRWGINTRLIKRKADDEEQQRTA